MSQLFPHPNLSVNPATKNFINHKKNSVCFIVFVNSIATHPQNLYLNAFVNILKSLSEQMNSF